MRLTEWSRNDIELELEETAALLRADAIITHTEMKTIREWHLRREYNRLADEKAKAT